MKKELFDKLYSNHTPVAIPENIIDKIKPRKISQGFENIQNIPLDKAAEDIEQFFNILKYCYSGYEYLENTVDASAVKADIINRLPQNTSTAELIELLYESLSEYINDTHFSFNCDNGVCFAKEYIAYFSNLTLEEDGGKYTVIKTGGEVDIGYLFTHDSVKDYLFETLPAKSGKRRYLLGVYSPVITKNITVAGFNLPLHSCKTDNFTPCDDDIKTEYIKNIPVVYHTTYGRYEVKHSPDDYKASGLGLKDSPCLVWSLLSNGGGDSTYPMHFMLGLNNNAVWEVDLAVIRNAAFDSSLPPVKKYDIYNIPKPDMTKSEYNGRLFVLQNKVVASSGEAAIMYARNVKNVCFVGSATAGCGQFGDNVTYELDNSKLRFRMGYKVFNMDGFDEGKGLLPDYWLDSENPVEDVIEYTKSIM